MTIEILTRRLSQALAFGGLFLLVAAVVCWVSAGETDVVTSIHNVGGSILAAFAVVFIGTGLALSARLPVGEAK